MLLIKTKLQTQSINTTLLNLNLIKQATYKRIHHIFPVASILRDELSFTFHFTIYIWLGDDSLNFESYENPCNLQNKQLMKRYTKRNSLIFTFFCKRRYFYTSKKRNQSLPNLKTTYLFAMSYNGAGITGLLL